jgi:hypothetical protein
LGLNTLWLGSLVMLRLETIRENTTLWVACQNIIAEVIKENNLPEGISCLINGIIKWVK